MGAVLTFVGGVVAGALCSWLITHKYYKRAVVEQKADLARLSEELRPKNTLADFEKFVESAQWTKREIDMREVWVCDADNTFQIVEGDESRDFTEPWTTAYPDRNGSASPVYLKVGSAVIKELTFVSMDGRRIFVPIAETRPRKGGPPEYFWNLNGLDVKVCRVIGSYYIYNDLEGVARRSNVTIIQ